jgi:DNA-binding NarL/FixJ family response regulator
VGEQVGLRGQLRVLVVDGEPCFALGLAALLRHEDIEVVGVASVISEALVLQAEPDAGVLDFNTLEERVSAVSRLAERYPRMKVVVLTAADSPADIYESFRSGVRAYLSKQARLADVVATLRLVCTGGLVIGPPVLTRFLQRPPESECELTEIELTLLRLVAVGTENARIAKQMAMSEATVKRRLREAEEKLKAKNRVEAAVHAAELGLI